MRIIQNSKKTCEKFEHIGKKSMEITEKSQEICQKSMGKPLINHRKFVKLKEIYWKTRWYQVFRRLMGPMGFLGVPWHVVFQDEQVYLSGFSSSMF